REAPDGGDLRLLGRRRPAPRYALRPGCGSAGLPRRAGVGAGRAATGARAGVLVRRPGAGQRLDRPCGGVPAKVQPGLTTRDEAAALDARDPLAEFRGQFVTDEQLVYLDGNSLGPLPRQTVQRLREVVEGQWGKRL